MTTRLYPYILVLKNESARYVNIIGFLLCAGSAVLFLREMVISNRIYIPYLIGILFVAGLILYNFFARYKHNRQIYYSKALLLTGLIWTRMPYFEWLIFVFALLALLEYQAKRAPEIGFASDHIVFNGLIKKKCNWSAIHNIILKDGLITIDFKNNRLLQKELESGDNEASEQEFNEWCRRMLDSAS